MPSFWPASKTRPSGSLALLNASRESSCAESNPTQSNMKNHSLLHRLAVCSWSLQPKDPADLFQQLQAIGINRLQFALDPIRENPAVWGSFSQRAAAAGVTL